MGTQAGEGRGAPGAIRDSEATTEHRIGRGSGSHQPRLPGERPIVRRERFTERNDGENDESMI